jgi:hypothetical protein
VQTLFVVEKQKSITHSKFVSAALGIQHAMCKRHYVMFPVRLYILFPLPGSVPKMQKTVGEANTSRLMAVGRPYGEFYDFYSVSLEHSGLHLLPFSVTTRNCIF